MIPKVEPFLAALIFGSDKIMLNRKQASSARHESMVKSAHEARDPSRFGPAAPLRSRACPGALERGASCGLVAVPAPRRRARELSR